jgi:hypothetical protein
LPVAHRTTETNEAHCAPHNGTREKWHAETSVAMHEATTGELHGFLPAPCSLTLRRSQLCRAGLLGLPTANPGDAVAATAFARLLGNKIRSLRADAPSVWVLCNRPDGRRALNCVVS